MFVPTSFPHLSVLGGSLSCNHGSKDVHHRLTKTVSHKAVVNSAYARKHDVNMLSIYLGRKFADCPTGHLMVTLWPEFFFFFLPGPGISSYASNPSMAGESLKECMREAQRHVPASHHSETSLYLGATAGMRLLEYDSHPNVMFCD